MTESIISNVGSIASLIGLIFVYKENSSTKYVKALFILVVCLSFTTSYLIHQNNKYESAQYQKVAESFNQSMIQGRIEREAQTILENLPSTVNAFDPGENEGIVYSVLGFVEKHKNNYPELYHQYKTNILGDIDKAKELRGTAEYMDIMENAAKASIRMLSSMTGKQKSSKYF